MSQTTPDKHHSELLLDSASEWVVRMSSDQISESALQEFALWLAQDDTHKSAYDEMVTLWQDLAVVEHLPFEDTLAIGDTAAGNVLDISTAAASQAPKSGNISWLFTRRSGFAVAASLLLVFVLQLNLQPAPEPQSYFTKVGEQLTIDLADGSTITLNTRSKIKVLLSDEKRLISIIQGEAFFEVAKDPNRPFIVNACSSTVRAVGTAFNVLCDNGDSKVAVTEGIVEVSSHQKPSKFILVKMGEQTCVDELDGLGDIERIADDSVAPWRHGELFFDDVLLSDVLQELGRYSNVRIELGSTELISTRVTGRFWLQDTDLLLRALQQSLSLRSEVGEDGIVRLYPAS